MVSPCQSHAPDMCGALAYPSPAEKELSRDLLNLQCAYNTEPMQKKGGGKKKVKNISKGR